MSYRTCQFDVAHLIPSYPRINKFNSTLFTKLLFFFSISDYSIIPTSANSTF
ncbi:hypothetical protein LINGRAHAP2_LOCUS38808 [Linum grandiflorum]